jgi:hypothetical protein
MSSKKPKPLAKTNKKHLKLTLLLLVGALASFAQAKSGVESYNYLTRQQEYTWMPVVHYQSAKGIYAELRYNYEELKTVSLFGGKMFEIGNEAAISVTPMIGFSAGDFKGMSLAAKTDLEWKGLYASAEMQYSMGWKGGSSNFFFSWSEAGYSFTSNLFGGLAMQFTRQGNSNDFQPGIVAGVEFGNISIPFYLFSPFKQDQYFVLGVNYEYQLKKKKKRAKGMYLG